MEMTENEKRKLLLKIRKWKRFAKLTYYGYFLCWLGVALGIYNSIQGMIGGNKIKFLQGNALTAITLVLIFFSNHIAKLYVLIEKILSDKSTEHQTASK